MQWLVCPAAQVPAPHVSIAPSSSFTLVCVLVSAGPSGVTKIVPAPDSTIAYALPTMPHLTCPTANASTRGAATAIAWLVEYVATGEDCDRKYPVAPLHWSDPG